ncbi:hypothetical protein MHYP_G00024510 [Metynnis hypsauchen]
MVQPLEEYKQACCKSIKVLSRALPDVGPSACLALLALDKKDTGPSPQLSPSACDTDMGRVSKPGLPVTPTLSHT